MAGVFTINLFSKIENFVLAGDNPVSPQNSIKIFRPGELPTLINSGDVPSLLMGTMTLEDLNNSHTISFAEKEENLESYFDSSSDSQIAHELHSIISSILQCLWFIRDNSCYCAVSYYIRPKHGHVHSNISNLAFSTASGDYENVQFSLEELDKAMEYKHIISKIVGKKEVHDGPPAVNDHISQKARFLKPSNRIERVIEMLTIARSQSILQFKISFYIAVIECLFSNDNFGLADKVGQRVALYLGGDSQTMRANYKAVKDAYDIRSKFVHGSHVSTTFEKITKLSVATDIILRKVFLKIFSEDTKKFINEEAFKEFLLQLVFGSIDEG